VQTKRQKMTLKDNPSSYFYNLQHYNNYFTCHSVTKLSAACPTAIMWSACLTNDHEVRVRVLLAADGRVATMGQLLFAPWDWVYSILHPFGIGKWVPAMAGKV